MGKMGEIHGVTWEIHVVNNGVSEPVLDELIAISQPKRR